MPVSLVAAIVGVWVIGAPDPAQVRAFIDEADFAKARQTLTAAEARPDLTREQLVELLELRALIHLAYGQRDAVQRALKRLAALDYNRRFSAATNPDLVAEYLRQRAELSGPLSLKVVRQTTPAGFEIGVRVVNPIDVASLPILELKGPRGWRTQSGSQLSVPLDPGEAIEYRARIRVGAVVVVEQQGELLRAAEETTISPWVWAGAAAVVVGAVVAAVIAAQPDEGDPVVGAPEVVWP